MAEQIHRLDSVFGIGRDLPETYVERRNIDDVLVESLARDRHIVIFGSSKQGKTCLRKHCLNDDDYIVVSSQSNWTLSQLHSAVLKNAGFTTQESQTRTADGRSKINLVFSGQIGGAGISGGIESERGAAETEHRKRLEIDPRDPNDIISALDEINFKRFIVLEDFHYLPMETQEDFSFSLKAFHEISDLIFIVVAVWREENRLIVFNGDLTGRIVAIDADAWNPDQLTEVIETGEALLNIKFPDQFKKELIANSFESVYIVQECCHRACRQAGIYETQQQWAHVDGSIDPHRLVQDVVSEQTGRYKSFLTNFAMGFQDTELEMYRWLLYPVIMADTDDLQLRLRFGDIRRTIQSKHPRGDALNPGNVTQALQSAPQLQSKKNIKPFVLDYDRTNLVLSVVDKGFLIWLANQEKNEILGTLDLPARG